VFETSKAWLKRMIGRMTGRKPRPAPAYAAILGNLQHSPAQLFGEIYRSKHWGGENRDFYSGSGSHLPRMVEPFVTSVRALLAGFPKPPVVVDLGCGDFAIGRRLIDLAQHYHACDVVPDLVARNRALFTMPNLSFRVVDAVSGVLPAGDVVIVKQVFQHLRNDQISAIVRKLAPYRTWIVTEHLPRGEFVPNANQLASGYTRFDINSGIVLTEEPFCIRPGTTDILCEVVEGGGLIRTTAYRF
jgi:hypothetical protein